MSRTEALQVQAQVLAWIEPLAQEIAAQLKQELSQQTAATEKLTAQIRQLAAIQLATAEAIQERLEQL